MGQQAIDVAEPPRMPPATPCNYCGQSIVWLASALSAADAPVSLPIDPEPSRKRGTILMLNGVGTWVSLIQAKQLRRSGQRMYVDHRNTCPEKDRWPGQQSRPQPTRILPTVS